MRAADIILLGFPHATGVSAGAIRSSADRLELAYRERIEQKMGVIAPNSFSADTVERGTQTTVVFEFDDGSRLFAIPEFSDLNRVHYPA